MKTFTKNLTKYTKKCGIGMLLLKNAPKKSKYFTKNLTKYKNCGFRVLFITKTRIYVLLFKKTIYNR